MLEREGEREGERGGGGGVATTGWRTGTRVSELQVT